MKKMIIGIDGLIRIASKHGLQAVSTAIGPGATGLTVICTLHLEDRDVSFMSTMAEVLDAGTGRTRVWLDHPEKMLRAYATRKAIETHFKDALRAQPAPRKVTGMTLAELIRIEDALECLDKMTRDEFVSCSKGVFQDSDISAWNIAQHLAQEKESRVKALNFVRKQIQLQSNRTINQKGKPCSSSTTEGNSSKANR
jgi:hypothetical protein